jgi:hypothetical protein
VPKPADIPHCSTEFDYSSESPRLRFAEGGRFLQLSFARSPAAQWNAEHFGERGGLRGKCKGFSFGSRRRMLNRLNCVSCASALPYFVTATLPDDVFDDDASRFAKSAKVWMDNFTKRLRRVCPTAAGFWRIEWQSRKSGRYEGKLFPHFHLLVWGLPERLVREYFKSDDFGHNKELVEVWEAFVPCRDSQMTWEIVETLGTRPVAEGWQRKISSSHNGVDLVFAGRFKFVERCRHLLDALAVEQAGPELKSAEVARNMSFQDWASLAWYHVVDSHNTDHLSAGVRVERVKSWGGVLSYCAKYMAKSDCGFLYDVSFGRSWGIFNRASVPWAKMVEIDLSPEVGVRLRRVARHYMERRFKRRVLAPYGVTLYCDVENFRRLWRPSPDPDPF